MTNHGDILKFWLEECTPKDWYVANPALDATIITRFQAVWDMAMAGGLTDWPTTPHGALAFLILTDQFPRNMFRGQAKAFATDALALKTAKTAIAQGLDLEIEGLSRQFFYLPFEHSESLVDQDRAVDLIGTRFDSADTLLHAQVHREIIRRFGRFPYRNVVLGRETTPEEQVFLDEGGYGSVLRTVTQANT